MTVAARRTGVAVIGDAIVDVIEDHLGGRTRHPGGAGLNVAVGIRRLGTPCILATPLAHDEDGHRLANHLRTEGVELVRLPGGTASGVAFSRRDKGEPEYIFSDTLLRRRFAFPPETAVRLADSRVHAITSFPMDDATQVDHLVALVHDGQLTAVIDPNVRPTLLGDVGAYREGFLRLAAVSALTKLSIQDARLLFGDVHPDQVVDLLLATGPAAVVLTAASNGVSVRTRGGDYAHAPAFAGPVADTMGAGDAVLARLLVEVEAQGIDLDEPSWRALLRDAMRIAAVVCRTSGGELPAGLTPRS